MEIKLSDIDKNDALTDDFVSHNVLDDELIYEVKQKKSMYFKIGLSLFYVLLLTAAFIIF